VEINYIQELPYHDYLLWLDDACAKTREDQQVRILICSHPKVLTMGRGDRQKQEHGLTSNFHEHEVVNINRGGGLTFHAPNQVILYPVIKLNSRFGLNDHLCMMAKAFQHYLAPRLELSYRRNPLGLWLNQKKAASIGVELRRFVTAHGLACNLQKIPFETDFFHALNPCGLHSDVYTSLAENGITDDWQTFAHGIGETYLTLLKSKL